MYSHISGKEIELRGSSSKNCNKQKSKNKIIKNEVFDMNKTKMALFGLASLVALKVCNDAAKIERPELTDAFKRYDKCVTLLITGNNFSQYKAFICDLDGKVDANGMKTADEVIVYKGDSPVNTISDINLATANDLENYVAEDTKEPMISKPIKIMTPEQREFYSRILNLNQPYQNK
jgi:hypothetical protein